MGKKNALQLDERFILSVQSLPKHILIKTPARICLFGDHQDYLGLPIIACAINRYMTFEGHKNGTDYFEIIVPDLGEKRIIPLDDALWKTNEPIDFFIAGLRVAKRYNCIPLEGFTITITSTIPINAGVSSSSALTVGWIHFLLNAFGTSEKITPEFIGKLAYEAEVIEHHSPGGKMDQYTIAIGETIFLETGEKTQYQKLGIPINGLILAESGIRKETIGTLKNTRKGAEKAIEKVMNADSDFDIHKARNSNISSFQNIVGPELFPYFEAAVTNHYITQTALAEFKQLKPNAEKLGQLMTQHHNVLMDLLGVSHPQIDTMLKAAIQAGAFGGKIVGSGGGGCAVVLASEEKKKAIINAFLEAGAKTAYEVQICQGSFVIHEV
ncbi:MAG: galactokinase family protein [Flavobacteriaceae bacterium]